MSEYKLLHLEDRGKKSKTSLPTISTDDNYSRLQLRQTTRMKKYLRLNGSSTNRSQWVERDLPNGYLSPSERQPIGILTELPDAHRSFPCGYFFKLLDESFYGLIANRIRLYHTRQDLRCQIPNKPLLPKFLGFMAYFGCIDLDDNETYWESYTG